MVRKVFLIVLMHLLKVFEYINNNNTNNNNTKLNNIINHVEEKAGKHC